MARGSSPSDGAGIPILRLRPEPLLGVLIKHKVKFIVVGGYAVNAHGVVRSTKDVDICPDPEPENLRRLAKALNELDVWQLGTEDFTADELPFQPDFRGLSEGGNFTLGSKYGRLDIMQKLDGVDGYSELSRNTVDRNFVGHKIRFCGYDELVAMKKAAGRDQDRIDLRDLQAARGEL